MTALLLLLAAQAEPTIPGVTVWAYEIGETLSRRPTIVEGQAPNYYRVHEQIKFVDQFKSDDVELKDQFCGLVQGWIQSDKAEDVEFKLECDDGALLSLNGKPICDSEDAPEFTAIGRAQLKKGLNPLRIDFYEDAGRFRLTLSWKRPGDKEFQVVPGSAFRTEPGQTFVTSPGPKRWFYGRDPRQPGDGRPLDAPHPGTKLEDFRGPDFRPAVGAMEFLPDGRLALATWDPEGAVYLLSNLNGPVKIQKFAEGLSEPLGLAWFKGDLYVTQKQEITRLRDLDGDGVADEYTAISCQWPMSANYHEFTFNLLVHRGQFLVASSVPLKSGVTAYSLGNGGAYSARNPVNGQMLSVDPVTGKWRAIHGGLRTPNGMGIGVDGEVFLSDNQGSWLPASRLDWIRPGGYSGHQDSHEELQPFQNPAIWFPHGEIGNSPSQPVLIDDGPYRGQMLVGDVTYGGIQRLDLEKIEGQYQGTVFRHSQGLEAGVNRLIWGPDGCLYVGGVGSNGNWNHKNKKFGLQRLRFNGKSAFEVKRMMPVSDGFVVEFTQPPANITDLNQYQVRQFRYLATALYGGPKLEDSMLSVASAIQLSPTRVHLIIPGLKEGRVVYLRLVGMKSTAGAAPWSTEQWHTLNLIPNRTPAELPLSLSSAPTKGVPVKLVPLSGSRPTWTQSGDTWTVKQGGGDMVSEKAYEDVTVSFDWMAPSGGELGSQMNGNSGVKLMGRYEIQILANPRAPYKLGPQDAGSIYLQRAAPINPGYGPGVWNQYVIRFRAPRWKNGVKTENARMSLWWNGILVHDNIEVPKPTGASGKDVPGPAPILFQAHASQTDGEVKFRNIRVD